MVAVCQGSKTKNDMIVEAVDQYKDMYVRAKASFAKVISVIMDVSCIERRSRLTRVRVFGSILKGVVDRIEAEIMRRAVLLLAGTAGTVALPLVETTEVGEEAALRHEALGKPQSLDCRTPQRGRAEPLLAQVGDEVPTVMKVRLVGGMIFLFFDHLSCTVHFLQIRIVGCCSLASPRRGPRAWPNPRTLITVIISCTADDTTTSTGRWSQHFSAANRLLLRQTLRGAHCQERVRKQRSSVPTMRTTRDV